MHSDTDSSFSYSDDSDNSRMEVLISENSRLKKMVKSFNLIASNVKDEITEVNKENTQLKFIANLKEFCNDVIKSDLRGKLNRTIEALYRYNQCAPKFMSDLTTALHESMFDMFLMEYLLEYADSVINNTTPVFDISNDMLSYFIRDTRLGSGYEVLNVKYAPQADIGLLSLKYGADFGDANNIRVLISYILESTLRATINYEPFFVNKVIDRSLNIGYLKRFCQMRNFDRESFRNFIVEDFVPSFKKGIKNRGYFVYNGEHFNKIKLPNSYELDNIMRYFSYIDVSRSDYQDTLNDFFKKLLYLCVRPEIINDVIENLNENMDQNLYYRYKYNDLLKTYNEEMYSISYLYKQGNNADAWIIPVTK